ncbi:MAG: hypothetical protein CVT92_16585 [Bacteroidetes bacterium HGW-Bacteroidetes-1]|jgi:hypothetical protein|nr:MAG: hypothetical protein CVT92_16585 [Bacteroidetes bacterium HGW-Bacteroidetes-1]
MKKLAITLAFFAFIAFGTSSMQSVIASTVNTEVVKTTDDDKKKADVKTKKSDCATKSSCCSTKKAECDDKKKEETK